jgi:hypothetical protein
MGEGRIVLAEIGNFFDKMFNKFLFRDVLSIIIPGLVLLLSLIYIWLGSWKALEASLNYWEMVFLIFLSYPVGWATLYLGVFTRLVKLSRTSYTWECPWNYYSIEKGLVKDWKGEMRFYNKLEELNERGIIDKNNEKIYFERIVAIRQMLGNLAFSLLLSGFVIVIFKWDTLMKMEWQKIIISFSSYILIITGLILAHRRLIKQIDIWKKSREHYLYGGRKMRWGEKEYLKEMWWAELLWKVFLIVCVVLIAFYGFENYNLGIKIGVIFVVFLLLDIRNFLERTTKEVIELNEDFVKFKEMKEVGENDRK